MSVDVKSAIERLYFRMNMIGMYTGQILTGQIESGYGVNCIVNHFVGMHRECPEKCVSAKMFKDWCVMMRHIHQDHKSLTVSMGTGCGRFAVTPINGESLPTLTDIVPEVISRIAAEIGLPESMLAEVSELKRSKVDPSIN